MNNTLPPPEIYSPRTSEGTYAILEILKASPDRQLSREDRDELLLIEREIAHGCYGDTSNLPADNWYKDVSSKVDFVLDYFDTDTGKQDFQDALNSVIQLPAEEINSLRVSRHIAELSLRADGNKDLKVSLKRLAARSHAYYADLIYEGQQGETDVSHFTMHTDPEAILQSISQVRRVRENLRFVEADIKKRTDISTDLRDALLTLVGIYKQKTAEALGKLYPDYVDLYQMAIMLTDGDERTMLLNSLKRAQEHMYIVAEHITDTEESNTHDAGNQFAWTMDRWRQGVVMGTEDSAISDDLADFARKVDTKRPADDDVSMQPVFTAEELQIIEAKVYDSAAIAAMVRYVLAQNGLLSTSKDYVPGEWPEDSTNDTPKIGVDIGQHANMQYKRGWILIPEQLKRKAFQQSPSGAFLVVAHELEHAVDGVTSYQSKGLLLGEVTSRGSSTIREGIGKAIEIETSRHLTGRSIRPSLTYYEALQAWLDTGSETAAIQVFAGQAAKEAGLQMPTKAQVVNAENRVQRLIGKHGINSQALVYIEQAAVAAQVDLFPKELRDYISCNSGLDLRSQALLHQFGILEPKRYKLDTPIIDCIKDYIRNNILNQEGAGSDG